MNYLGIYLAMSGNCEEAFNYYQTIFGGEVTFSRYKDGPQNPHADLIEGEKIMNATLNFDGFEIMGCDSPFLTMAGHYHHFHVILNVDSKEKTDKYFKALQPDSEVFMPIEDTFWGSYFGMLKDKFGVQWMVSFRE